MPLTKARLAIDQELVASYICLEYNREKFSENVTNTDN